MMVVSKAKNKRATEAQISHHRLAEEAGNLENKQAEQWIFLRSHKEKAGTLHSLLWVPLLKLLFANRSLHIYRHLFLKQVSYLPVLSVLWAKGFLQTYSQGSLLPSKS